MKELKASGKGAEAERRWRPVIRDLGAFLCHEDAAQITRGDLLRWKEARLASHSAKTVRDVDLAAVRAIFTWVVDNQRRDTNPAAGVKIRIAKRI